MTYECNKNLQEIKILGMYRLKQKYDKRTFWEIYNSLPEYERIKLRNEILSEVKYDTFKKWQGKQRATPKITTREWLVELLKKRGIITHPDILFPPKGK